MSQIWASTLVAANVTIERQKHYAMAWLRLIAKGRSWKLFFWTLNKLDLSSIPGMQQCVSQWFGSMFTGPEYQHEADEDMADGESSKIQTMVWVFAFSLLRLPDGLQFTEKKMFLKMCTAYVDWSSTCSAGINQFSKDDINLTCKRASQFPTLCIAETKPSISPLSPISW